MTDKQRSGPTVYVLMLLVLVWSGALAAGFTWAATSGELSTTRTAVFFGLAGFLALIAGRTGYELVRRVRGQV